MPNTAPEKGLVFSIDRFVAEDGPGLRTTVFLKGCPLCCTWCHSPQSISGKPQLIFYGNRCIRCGACVGACPKDAQYVSQNDRRVHWDLCDDCGRCAEVCPSNALEIEGRWLSVDEVIETVKRDTVYYRNSGGGVTFSGGEATLQPRFLTECLRRCNELGIHTAIDTCGYVRWPVLEKMLSYIDLFLFDVKHMDSTAHKKLTGVGNELILENLKKLSAAGKSIWIRIPLIPGHNDSESNLQKTAQFVSSLDGVKKITLLPYNDAAGAKYEFIGAVYELEKTEPYLKEKYESIVEHFSAHAGCSREELLP